MMANYKGSQGLLMAKKELDSLNSVLTKISKLEVSKENRDYIMVKIELAAGDYNKEVARVLGAMGRTNNVVALEGNWYAVRYVTAKGEPMVAVTTISKEDVYLFELADDRKKDLTKNEVDTLVPALVEETSMSNYRKEVDVRANEILALLSIVEDRTEESVGEFSITDHACKRWVQRKIGLSNDKKVAQYLEESLEEVREEIRSSYQTSQCVWVDDEDIEYWLDDCNLVYVVGKNTIITMYEKDFGFSKKVNRDIIISQLETIKESWETLRDSESLYVKNIDKMNLALGAYDLEIEALEDKIACVVADKKVLTAKKNALMCCKTFNAKQFEMEFNRLFSRHRRFSK